MPPLLEWERLVTVGNYRADTTVKMLMKDVGQEKRAPQQLLDSPSDD
jgi:hypothetical protein